MSDTKALSELRRRFEVLALNADRRVKTCKRYDTQQRNVGRSDAYWHAMVLVTDLRDALVAAAKSKPSK